MKSIEEQTREASIHYDLYEAITMDDGEDGMRGFIAGAEWERDRDKWISTESEWPECDVPVLVYTPFAKCHTMIAYWNGFDWIKKVFDFEKKIDYLCEVGNVFYWQPLPEPPKQKED